MYRQRRIAQIPPLAAALATSHGWRIRAIPTCGWGNENSVASAVLTWNYEFDFSGPKLVLHACTPSFALLDNCSPAELPWRATPDQHLGTDQVQRDLADHARDYAEGVWPRPAPVARCQLSMR